MKVLIDDVTLYPPQGTPQQHSVAIDNGQLFFDAPSPHPDYDLIINGQGLGLSPGWFDLRARTGEPGNEQKETLHSFSQAASEGGFTGAVLMPSTQPPLQYPSDLERFKRLSQQGPLELVPAAALTENRKGQKLIESVDLMKAGLRFFTDDQPTASGDILLKSVHYISTYGGLPIDFPLDQQLAEGGQARESQNSTRLGLKGIPEMAEYSRVSRAIEILEYTGGNLHLGGLFSPRSLEKVAAAKKAGLQLSCDVPAYLLAFSEEALESFNTHFKLMPPLQSRENIERLKGFLQDGTVDAVVSEHRPQDYESKECEWLVAEFGGATIETVFATFRTFWPELPLPTLLDWLHTKARSLAKLPAITLREGQPANLTLFDPVMPWKATAQSLRSKNPYSPFIGQKLTGKALATFRNQQLYLSPWLKDRITRDNR